MLNYNEIRPRKVILMDGDPWQVIDYQVSRKQQNKPVNKTKLKNLVTGQQIDHTFHVSDKATEADLERRDITYQFYQEKKDEYWFSNPDNPKDRFTIDSDVVGDDIKWIKERTDVRGLVFIDKEGEESIIGVEYPMKVELKVTHAPPSIKGNTATGGKKIVTLETGATVNTPLFIEEGEIIVINTEKGEYVERAK